MHSLQPMESVQNIVGWTTDNHLYAPCSNYEYKNSQNDLQEEMPVDFSKEVPFQKY